MSREQQSTPVLVVSHLAVLVQLFHTFFMSKSFEVFGPGGSIMPLMVIVITIALFWLARRAKKIGWLS
jgi:hypothetical protein